MTVSEICARLQAHQRERNWYIGSRVMLHNRMLAIVARDHGYSSDMSEADRDKQWTAARADVAAVRGGESLDNPRRAKAIGAHLIGLGTLSDQQEAIEKEMLGTAKLLPVAEWLESPDCRGFGLQSLATLVGEAGDISNYSNPAKLWKRFGCAPIQGRDGRRQMGSTWRRTGGLSAEEWTAAGYSPRRRSTLYVVTECLLKQNKGRYRQRYDEAKAAKLADPDFCKCNKCGGEGKITGKAKKQQCPTCKGKGNMPGRAHRHGMLLMGKLLLRDLWNLWHGKDINYKWSGEGGRKPVTVRTRASH